MWLILGISAVVVYFVLVIIAVVAYREAKLEQFPCCSGHDYEMEFPDGTLNWEFRCNRCGHVVHDIYEAKRNQEKGW